VGLGSAINPTPNLLKQSRTHIRLLYLGQRPPKQTAGIIPPSAPSLSQCHRTKYGCTTAGFEPAKVTSLIQSFMRH